MRTPMPAEVSDTPAGRASDLPWHKWTVDQVLERLDTSRDGLAEASAAERLEAHGPNRLGEHEPVSGWRVLLNQFRHPLIYVLLGALVVTLLIRHWSDAIMIAVVLAVNATLGFLQEYRAEAAVEALMRMIAPKARVRRGGREAEVDSEQLVPGDVVRFGEGEMVPADVRLLEVKGLQVNEAALTGESVPVPKTQAAQTDAADDAPPAGRANMAFMGTAITTGSATAVVVATGPQSQVGDIATLVRETGPSETPLMRRMHRLSLWITGAILVVSALAFGMGLWVGETWQQMLLLVVSLAVAAIPEGLPIVITVALAIGVRRMAHRNAVIRNLPAVETLGSCTVILSDKTGTLTQNRMAVRKIAAGDHDFRVGGEPMRPEGRIEAEGDGEGEAVEAEPGSPLHYTLLAGLLASDVDEVRDDDEPAKGDPMEIALTIAAVKGGLDREALARSHPRVDEVPFVTERRFNATIHDTEAGPLVLLKGAPEQIAEMCRDRLGDDGAPTALDREALAARSEALAREGLRVLGMAIGRGDDAREQVKRDAPAGFTFVGLQGLLDPPRPSAVPAVDACHRAGIRVLMVTGDHAATAAAIAEQVHVDEAGAEVLTGHDVQEASDEALDAALGRVNVYARVKPDHKHRLVERLKARGEVVAVTGDGVNDAPALKAAHLGAAMGSGTDVAKQASDMVITDDDFASIYAAVEEGRTAFRNIRMGTFFLLSTGAADVLVILVALGIGWPLPLLPAQILWGNVVTNGIADVALAFEPGEPTLYHRPPRSPEEGVLSWVLIERLALVGIWLSVGVLFVFSWVRATGGDSFADLWQFVSFEAPSGTGDLTVARTAALTTMVLFQMVHVFNCRSEDLSFFAKSPLKNKVLLVGVLASLAVHVAALYLPATQQLLSVTPLGWQTWVVMAAIALTAILVNEGHKALRSGGAARS